MRVQSLLALAGVAFASQLACATDRSPSRDRIQDRRARAFEATLDAIELADVRERDLRAAFPALIPAHELWRACFGDDLDLPSAEAFFGPAAVGEHLSEMPRVECVKRFDQRVTCELSFQPTYFVEDPARSFAIGDIGERLSPEEALTVVRLFETGAWHADDGRAGSRSERTRWRVYRIHRAGKGYSLEVARSDCGGCSALLWLEPVRRRGEMIGLRADSSTPATACLEGYVDWLEPQSETGAE